MKITKTDLPQKSILSTSEYNYDYVDSFRGAFVDETKRVDSTQIGQSFFSAGPKWVENLFELRNKLVGLIGLKTSGDATTRQQMLNRFNCEPGEQMGLFKVLHKTPHEVVLGEDDKHLNFRVSLWIDNHSSDKTLKNLTISTTVQFNNWFGRLYFIPVRPFHKIIVPTILKGIIRDIERLNEKLMAN
ncbi:hypothetical protein BFP72_03010 [Reichenbachiella sp. 5M10]|uniref:DUF2867 domain-containing protein n=1 Tax=Reichenbachiella sp. 5M10 TaxID=1889772 RepID=UPI000C4DD942|nr:DUF2867 domain-containing protein [Reichenbachiella sp. 5M10]PIB37368.1 hypothetical protein BFP72_03010 [Reichenbachiella sp. 5M10]